MGDTRGAKGRKETCGAADDEVEEEVEEEGVGGGRGEVLVVLWGDGWLGLEGARAEDAVREVTLWTEARAVGVRRGGMACWQPARGGSLREVGEG